MFLGRCHQSQNHSLKLSIISRHLKYQFPHFSDTFKPRDQMLAHFKSWSLSSVTVAYFNLNVAFPLINGSFQKLDKWREAILKLNAYKKRFSIYTTHFSFLISFFFVCISTANIIFCLYLHKVKSDFTALQPFEFRLKWNAFVRFNSVPF